MLQYKQHNSVKMAHHVQSQSYIAINNFYIVTVYGIGAELVRMIETIVAKDTFTKGLQHYLSKHDGQAYACGIEDFVNAMEYVSNGKHDLNRMCSCMNNLERQKLKY